MCGRRAGPEIQPPRAAREDIVPIGDDDRRPGRVGRQEQVRDSFASVLIEVLEDAIDDAR